MGEAKRRREYLAKADEDAKAAAIQAQVHKTHAWWEARGQAKDPYLRVGTIEGKAPGINRRTYRSHKAKGGAFVPAPPRPPAGTKDSSGTLDSKHTCKAEVRVLDGRTSVIHSGSSDCKECQEVGPPLISKDGRIVS